MITISIKGTTAFADGATRKNGAAWVLKARNWYWLNSVQAYVYKGPDTLLVVEESATALREAGFSVERDQ